jgi:hypothetical protein
MHHRPFVAATAALALAGSLSTLSGATAAAAPAELAGPTVTTLAKSLLAPLSVAQAPDGTRYWTDDFAGLLYRQAPGGQPVVAYKGKAKAGVESVSADRGVLRFTTGAEDNSAGKLMTLDPAGNAVQVADIYAYEKKANPDGKQRYGFLDSPKSCTSLMAPTSPGAAHRGVVESHPYATATAANGTTYVADAAANAVFAVSPAGVVSTVAVIDPAEVKITKNVQVAADLPDCLLGKVVSLESVPTDVEVGPDGMLYVASFGGGPEHGGYGANGRISRIDPSTGKVTVLSKGYPGLTGIAVAANGDIYAADLFMGAILVLPSGRKNPRTYVELPFPGAVEVTPAGLLATSNVLPGKKPKGKVVSITP